MLNGLTIVYVVTQGLELTPARATVPIFLPLLAYSSPLPCLEPEFVWWISSGISADQNLMVKMWLHFSFLSCQIDQCCVARQRCRGQCWQRKACIEGRWDCSSLSLGHTKSFKSMSWRQEISPRVSLPSEGLVPMLALWSVHCSAASLVLALAHFWSSAEPAENYFKLKKKSNRFTVNLVI